METTTETNPNNRELTTTEIQIAIAQIQDRLTRYVKAERELYKLLEEYCDTNSDDAGFDEYEKSAKEKIRIKYDIPDSVFLWGLARDDEPCSLTHVNEFVKPYVSAFVKGKLDEESLSAVRMFFDEVDEYDYGWILIERPFCYYQAGGQHADSEEIEAEITQIGTRSKTKARNLPPIQFGFAEDDCDE